MHPSLTIRCISYTAAIAKAAIVIDLPEYGDVPREVRKAARAERKRMMEEGSEVHFTSRSGKHLVGRIARDMYTAVEVKDVKEV